METKKRWKFIFFITVALFLSTTIAFSSNLTDEQKALGTDACEHYRNSNDPKDPCNEADLKDKAELQQYASSTVYGAAAATCLAGCAFTAMAAACPTATMAGGVTDTVGSALVSQKAENIMAGFAGPGMSALQKQIDKEDAPEAKDAKDSAKGSEEQKNAAQEKQDKKERHNACLLAVQDGVQSFGRFQSANQAGDSADQARQNKLQMLGKTNQLSLSKTGNAGDGGGPQGLGYSSKGESALSMGKKLTAEDVVATAVQSGGAEALRRFEQFSGKPATLLADKILSGQNPMAAAVGLASEKLGTEATTAGLQLAAESQNLYNSLEGKSEGVEFASAEKTSQDASFGGAAKPTASVTAGGAEGNLLGDLKGLMDNYLPQKQRDKEHAGSGMRGFRKPGSAQVTADGLHLASKSIFEIVGTRYQLLAQKFLEGGGIVGTSNASAGIIPTNPYLRK